MPAVTIKFEDFKISMLLGYVIQLESTATAPIYVVAKQGVNFVGIQIGSNDNAPATYNVVALDPNASPKAVFGKIAVLVTP